VSDRSSEHSTTVCPRKFTLPSLRGHYTKRQKLYANWFLTFSRTSKAAWPTGRGSCSRSDGTEGALAIVPADPRQATYIQVSEFTVRGAQAGKPLADLSIPESYRWVPPAVPTGLPFNVAQLFMRMVKAFAKESPSAQTSMRPSNATSCLTRFRRRRTPGSARFFSDDRPTVRRRCRSLGEPAVDLREPRAGLHRRVQFVKPRPPLAACDIDRPAGLAKRD
jgi:hypothetical protein